MWIFAREKSGWLLLATRALEVFSSLLSIVLDFNSPKPYTYITGRNQAAPKRKQTPMTSNTRFVSLMLSIPVVAGLLVGGCVNAASAAETREPGRCSTTEILVTDRKTGEQHIDRKTVCECSEQNPCTSRVASR